MIIYPGEEEILIVGEIACGFKLTVCEPSQFTANVNRPATTVFGEDAYPSLWEKAASLLHSFCITQTLLDGNKRTGWAACWLFLRLNSAVESLSGKVDTDLAEDLVLRVAAGDADLAEIAADLRSLAFG